MSINAGTLYVVATPLGHLDDITYRAVQVLKEVDLIAAEDTRHSAKLLSHYAIKSTLVSLHKFNERQQSQQLLDRLLKGESIALISDAGTPLINDPGYRLVSGARAVGVRVSPIPGPCAAIAALSAAGLPTHRFIFEGYLPAKAKARRRRLQELEAEARTLVFYESCHRVVQVLQELRDLWGFERRAVIARELTKVFETVQSGNLGQLNEWLQRDPNHQRGEFVLVVEGSLTTVVEPSTLDLNKLLSALLVEIPLNHAVRLAVQITGAEKNKVYRMALALKEHRPLTLLPF